MENIVKQGVRKYREILPYFWDELAITIFSQKWMDITLFQRRLVWTALNFEQEACNRVMHSLESRGRPVRLEFGPPTIL